MPETLAEIGHELDLEVRPLAHIILIPCLNDDDEGARVAHYLRRGYNDRQTLAQMSYSEESAENIPKVTYKSQPMGGGESGHSLLSFTLF